MVVTEVLSLHYGIMQFELYPSGLQHFDVIRDHEPFNSMFHNKDLFEINIDKLKKIKTKTPKQICVYCRV